MRTIMWNDGDDDRNDSGLYDNANDDAYWANIDDRIDQRQFDDREESLAEAVAAGAAFLGLCASIICIFFMLGQ